MERTSIQIQQEITAGEAIALKLKGYYHPNDAWTPILAWNIGVLLRDIKRAAKKFYVDKDVIEILNFLKSYKKDDFDELLSYDKK